LYNINDVNKNNLFKNKLFDFILVNTDGMDILNSKKFKQNQIKDIVKPQPVVGNKEKHPTLLRGKIHTK
jgi:hypothetical protein